MIISCVFICVFAVLINKVCLLETVEAVIGGSVLLPCSSTEEDHKLEDINVHWRHNGSKNVCDIVKGKDSLELQDPRYKNRAETFPQKYKRGNYSIKLTDLTHTDAGKYICYITPSSEQKTVQLIINKSTAEKGTVSTIISTEQENQGETELDSVETSWTWLWVGIASVITVAVIVIVIVIGFIVACRIRKNSSSRRADRQDMGSDDHELEHMNQ